MNATELIAIVKSRGLSIRLDDKGRPVVSGDVSRCTPALIEALKTHRKDILNHLGYQIPIQPKSAEPLPEHECLWPGNGYVGPHWFPDRGWPTGAYFFRKIGDSDWLPIPGRTWDESAKCGTFDTAKAKASA